MSDFAPLLSICPALAKAGIEAAQIAEKDIHRALEKLNALSTCLIRMIFHLEGLADPANALPPLTMINRLTNRSLLPIDPVTLFPYPDQPAFRVGK